MKTLKHKTDFCVVGGGIAGICAALAAARNGLETILVHDRPVLGGNASSEIRMWICGAHGENNRETGIIEELLLENLYQNPEGNYSLWDSVLYGKVRYQDNLTLLLNTTCLDATLNGNNISSIRAWELNSETWHHVEAKMFSDCSGDSILVPLTRAEFRRGREASSEFNEDIAPEAADRKTMGHSCLIQARETHRPVDYQAPEWANKYESFDEFPNRGSLAPDAPYQNYWWIELGGDGDALHDSAKNRDELLKACLGVWNLIKNHPDTKEKYRNWELEWMGFLPGKRESRRYVGDVIITQNDVRNGHFKDVAAYGGWSMDDHNPGGLNYPGAPTIFHKAPSPYQIPYRSLYSRNIGNLFCAGRNVSATHSALSSTRVQATCGTLGHAVGVAASLAVKKNTSPRGVYEKYLDTLQQTLLKEDAYLPGLRYKVSKLCENAKLSASNQREAAGVRLGVNRIIGDRDFSWTGSVGDTLTYEWDKESYVESVRIVLDSDLNRKRHNIVAMRSLDFEPYRLPSTLAKKLKLEYKNSDKNWVEFSVIDKIHRRLLTIPCDLNCVGLRLTITATHGDETIKVFAFDF